MPPRAPRPTPLLALLLCAAVLLVACGDDGITVHDGGTRTRFDGGGFPPGDSGQRPPDAGRPDAGPARPPDVPGSRTLDFVVSVLQVGVERPATSGVCAGFDLDSHVTSSTTDLLGCGHVDFTAPARFGGYGGVDNRLGPVLSEVSDLAMGFDANAQLRDNVAQGKLLLLVRLTDVGNLRDDGLVGLSFYVGKLPVGVTMPATDPVTIDGEVFDALRGGQSFLVDPRSVTSHDLGQPLIAFTDAFVASGRLYAGPSPFSLDVMTNYGPLSLSVRNAQLEADVSETGLTRGVLGGHLLVTDVVTALSNLRFPDITLPVDLVRNVLRQEADIDADGDPLRCEALSVGFTLESTSATIAGLAPDP